MGKFLGGFTNNLSLVLTCGVYTCRFDNQVPKKKAWIKVFLCWQGHSKFSLYKG